MNACEMCGDEAEQRYLCDRCTASLARRLAEFPALYGELADCLVPRRSGFGEFVSSAPAGPRSPLDEDVLDLVALGGAARVLEARRADVQRVRWPEHGAPPAEGVMAACRWLGMELDWIVAHYPAAGELAGELRALEGEARSIVGDPAPRPQRLGTCVAVTDAAGTVCGAFIDRLPGQTRVRCPWCGYVYATGLDWMRLQHFQPKESV